MTLATAKQKLHDYIEHADGKKVKAMYTLFENEIEPDYELTDAEMKELDSRWDEYLSGKTRSYTLEESKEKMRKYIENKRKNGL